jgi:DNA-directed RNA polymerase specialized sigma subunit
MIWDMSKRLTAYQRFLRDVEARKEKVLELSALKIRQRVIARRLGLSEGRVSQIVTAAKKMKAAS